MDKSLIEGNLGKELNYELEFVDGELCFLFGYDGKGIDAGTYVKLEPEYFLDKLAEAIPGNVDDAVIAAIKAAIK